MHITNQLVFNSHVGYLKSQRRNSTYATQIRLGSGWKIQCVWLNRLTGRKGQTLDDSDLSMKTLTRWAQPCPSKGCPQGRHDVWGRPQTAQCTVCATEGRWPGRGYSRQNAAWPRARDTAAARHGRRPETGSRRQRSPSAGCPWPGSGSVAQQGSGSGRSFSPGGAHCGPLRLALYLNMNVPILWGQLDTCLTW